MTNFIFKKISQKKLKNSIQVLLLLFFFSNRRVKKLLSGGGKVAIGGETEDSERFISPTVLRDVQSTDTIMQDEVCFSLHDTMERESKQERKKLCELRRIERERAGEKRERELRRV